MDDPVFTAEDFLRAETVVDHLVQNLAIQFQIEGDTYDHDAAQRNVTLRSAMIVTKGALLDEVERLMTGERPKS